MELIISTYDNTTDEQVAETYVVDHIERDSDDCVTAYMTKKGCPEQKTYYILVRQDFIDQIKKV